MAPRATQDSIKGQGTAYVSWCMPRTTVGTSGISGSEGVSEGKSSAAGPTTWRRNDGAGRRTGKVGG
jgi:hypothetical protein